MKGVAIYTVLSLMTRSRVAFDDRHYGYPKPTTASEEQQAVTTGHRCSSRERISRPIP
jgi:hypothetical protein